MAGSIWDANGVFMAASIWTPTTFTGQTLEAALAAEVAARVAGDESSLAALALAVTEFNLALATKANLAGGNTFTGAQSVVPIAVTGTSGTLVIDWALGNVFTVTLTGTASISFINPTPGQIVVIHFKFPTGAPTITFATDILFSDGTDPLLSTSDDAEDQLAFIYNGDISKYIGGAGVIGAL